MATPATLASGFPKDLLAALRGLANGTYEALFIFYVFLLVNLPAGTLFGINFKTICFVVLLPAVLFRFFNDRHTTYVHVALLLVIPTALLTWAFVPLLGTSDEGFSFTEYKDIITTSSSCWLVAVYCGHSWERCVSFLRIVLTAELLAASTKVLMLVYCVETGTPVSTLITLINDVFKVNLMGLDFGAMLGRIQLIADGLIPICIFMLVRYRTTIRLSVGKSLLAFVLLTISLVFTYSRYFWAFGVLAFVLGLIAGKKDRFHAGPSRYSEPLRL